LGFGLSKEEVLEMIRRYVNENNITKSFKGGARDDLLFSSDLKMHK
jgi:hypothetical protein